MNCTEVSALVPLYLSGELDHIRASELAAHLSSCPACYSELRQLAGFDTLLRENVLAGHVESGPLERRVRSLISHESQRILHRWIYAAVGIAAVALIAALGYRAVFTPRITRVYAAAARDHRFEIVDRQPRKWFTDEAAIEELAGKQGFPETALAAIVPAGYRLTQGKLCRLDGLVFLHLVYAGEAGNFSVFLRRGSGKSTPVLSSAIGAEHVAGFDGAQLSVLIVTEESDNAALRLAKFAAAAL